MATFHRIGTATLGLVLAGWLAATPDAIAAEATCVVLRSAAIRVAPTASGEALATAPAGLTVRVMAPENGWAKITSPGAALGAFIAAAACQLSLLESTNAQGPVASAAPRTATSLTGSGQPSTPVQPPPTAFTAHVEQPKKKGGSFWKKVGKGLLIGAAVAAIGYAAANSPPSAAGGSPTYQPVQEERWPCPGFYSKHTYDATTGNSYAMSCSGSEIQVLGNNMATSSIWHTYLKPNGDMHGTDSAVRSWTYIESTGAYWRSDGRTCHGSGSVRTCYGPPE